jgi:hypothetical protein
MAIDLRTRKIAMPIIPSSRTVRERLAEVLTQAEKLKVLLRIATELETVKPPNQSEVEP